MKRRVRLIAVAVCSMGPLMAACRCRIPLVRRICNSVRSTNQDKKSSSSGVHKLESSCRYWWTRALNIRKNTGVGAANLRAAPHLWRNEGCMLLHFQSYRKQFLDFTPTPCCILAPPTLHPRSHSFVPCWSLASPFHAQPPEVGAFVFVALEVLAWEYGGRLRTTFFSTHAQPPHLH